MVFSALAAPCLLLQFLRMGSARGRLAKLRVVLVIPGQGMPQRWAWHQHRGRIWPSVLVQNQVKKSYVKGLTLWSEKNPSVRDVGATGNLEGTEPHLLDARVV